MKFVGDFHIHSHYSIATSKQLIPEYLDLWARIKGIQVVGSGDISHPGWLAELEEKTERAEEGLYTLKKDFELPGEQTEIFGAVAAAPKPRFILSGEISSIYKKDGKVRKVHNIVVLPDFEAAHRFQNELDKRGNITSDGRPILGLDSRDLLEITLNVSEDAFFIPAHIWTPWFSALGAKSGFESIDECFGDLAGHIYAVETGLSSDPPMNWMCSFLDKYTLISNSDAHSPEKLGREANLFDTDLSYPGIINAMKQGKEGGFQGTLEFFPQEGKYHYDGHRKCGVCSDPLESLKFEGICSECGKKMTIGVMNRVAQLADRKSIDECTNRNQFHSLVPLKEILSEILRVGENSKKVKTAYQSLITKGGSEFDILLNMPYDQLENIGSEHLAEGIRRMRNREVFIQEGYDGEYGRIKVFQEKETASFGDKDLLFDEFTAKTNFRPPVRPFISFDLKQFKAMRDMKMEETTRKELSGDDRAKSGKMTIFGEKKQQSSILDGLNGPQKKAAEHCNGPLLILAGPGTGKTRTISYRIAYLIDEKGINPRNILGVTFTNKAAGELKDRVRKLLQEGVKLPPIETFHSFGMKVLRYFASEMGLKKDFLIIDDDQRLSIITDRLGVAKKQVKNVADTLSGLKKGLISPESEEDTERLSRYEEYLKNNNLLDFDDLICKTTDLLKTDSKVLGVLQKQLRWILVDEFQDVNALQYELLRLLMGKTDSNICAIGDPNQAIYGFRGADAAFIDRFQEDYQGLGVYALDTSYRCSNTVLKAAQQVLRDDTILRGLKPGIKIHIAPQVSGKSEAEFIARKIENMIGGLRFFSMDSDITRGNENTDTQSLSDFAVLCRTGRQMADMEKAFNDHSIPYQRVGEVPFFKKEPAKTIIQALQVIFDPSNTYRSGFLEKNNNLSKTGVQQICSINRADKTTLALINEITPYLSFPGGKERSWEKNIERLKETASVFEGDCKEFIDYVTLGGCQDDYNRGTEKVTLITLHASKGLEWKCVFIPGCEDGLLPLSLFENQKSDPREEERLFYVGMTRAEKYLYLTHAKKRILFGQEYELAPSPFLGRIEKVLTEAVTSEYKRKETKTEAPDDQLDLF